MAKMSMLRTLMCLAATTMLMESAIAVNYTVGGLTGGWDTTTNLQAWASSQTFLVGDNLTISDANSFQPEVFQYTPNHNLLEVSKADYDSCQASSPIQLYIGGTSVIPLAAPGSQYFICGTPGHCSQGMKVEIDILASSVSPPAFPPSADTPTSPIPSPMISPSPSDSPVSSPTAAIIPTTESPFDGNTSPSPPSAASKEYMMVGSIVGISFFMTMLFIL